MADYAVVTMSAAARRGETARFCAADLASDTGVPLPTVQKLASMLGRAGLLLSVRGAGGGLRLARPAQQISLADIVEAVEGPIALTACVEAGRHDCTLEQDCSLRPRWGAVNAAVRGALAGMSLAEMALTAPGAAAGAPMSGQVPAQVNVDQASVLEANGIGL